MELNSHIACSFKSGYGRTRMVLQDFRVSLYDLLLLILVKVCYFGHFLKINE